jgi:hypothetical protein
VADPEEQAALVEVAFPPERERAVRAVVLGSALGLLLSLAARMGARDRRRPR